MTSTELAQTIQDRLDVLYREIALLEHARDELHSNGSGTAQAPPSKALTVRPRRRSGLRRRPEVVATGRLEALLAEHGATTSTDLARLTRGRRDQVLTLLRDLEAAGRVRRTGQRRGTRWHVITDEDRINARAAELEKQSRRARSDAKRAGQAA